MFLLTLPAEAIMANLALALVAFLIIVCCICRLDAAAVERWHLPLNHLMHVVMAAWALCVAFEMLRGAPADMTHALGCLAIGLYLLVSYDAWEAQRRAAHMVAEGGDRADPTGA